MFAIVYTNRFKKDINKIKKRNWNLDLIKEVILQLESSGSLPEKFNPHKLSGNYSGFWEAHIKPDWLIIWKTFPKENEIWLTRTGSHADLF